MSDTEEKTKIDLIMNETAYHKAVDDALGGDASHETHLVAERQRLATVISRLEAQIGILKSQISELDAQVFLESRRIAKDEKGE